VFALQAPHNGGEVWTRRRLRQPHYRHRGGEEAEIPCPHVHTQKLLPFFRACLDAPMKEALSGIVGLPEDDPAAFQELLDFAYRCSFRTKLSHESQLGDEYDTALVIRIHTFFLAEKMMAEEIQNAAIDTIIDPFEGRAFRPTTAVLSLLFDDEQYADRAHIQHLRDWVANELACAIREPDQDWEGWAKDHPDVYAWLLKSPSHLNVIGRGAFSDLSDWDCYSMRRTKCRDLHSHRDIGECKFTDGEDSEEG
jgi:hypothetical protein